MTHTQVTIECNFVARQIAEGNRTMNAFRQSSMWQPLNPFAVWLNERGDVLNASFSSADQQIATQIASELAVN